MEKKSQSVLALLLALITCLNTQAQLTTNKEILQKASQLTAAKENALITQLLTLSKQKGWPLKIKGRLGRIAVLHGIDDQGNPLYISTFDNIISAATIGTNLLWPGGSSGLNLTGSSAAVKGKIAIWDEAEPRPTHKELTGRVTQKDNANSISDHSTHVAGTLIAAGVNPLAKGMAFGAQQLLAYDFNNDNSEMMAEASNLLVSNHSYGSVAGWYYNSGSGNWEFYGNYGDTADFKFGYYSSDAQVWDSISYNAPDYLIVKAAGNNRGETGPAVGQPYYRYNKVGNMASAGNRPAGISSNDAYDILPTASTAKNILTVGAVNPIPGGYSGVHDVSISDFSSWGPTDDGRIKPDVVADGVNVLSSVGSSDSSYDTYSGTSMATPAATGSLLLLQEYYSRLHSGTFMRSATLKGIVIHTADEAGTADGPDYIYGWGLINMQKAAAVISSDTSTVRDQRIYENILGNTASDSVFTLPVVASGKGPLVVTISWTDPAGTPVTTNLLNNPAKMLINDLDLRVTSGPYTWKPYVLDRKNPGLAATTGDDTLNNVEKIVVNNVVPGQAYIIKVTHKGILARGIQAYSLLVSGAGGQLYCGSGATSSAGTRIDSVIIGNIRNGNPAGCTTYTNYTGQIIRLQPNQKVPVTVKLSSCDASTANKVVKVFIDYNSDGVFGADELAAVSGVLNGGGVTYSDTIRTPSSLNVGNYGLMRIVAEETSDTGVVKACGAYANGETQDYTVQIIPASIDAGISEIVAPIGASCASDSQLVTIRIKNFGSATLQNVSAKTVVMNGANTVAVLTVVYPDSIPAYGNIVYTYQAGFNALAGNTYTFTSFTSLNGDQLASNDTTRATLTISSLSGAPGGQAELCGTDKVYLKANTGTGGAAFWYDSANAVTPFANGSEVSTSIIPANNTYYLGRNDGIMKVGPSSKSVYPAGGYNSFSYNFVNFTNYVPVTIESARLYIGYPGKITFVVADISNFDTASGGYNISVISSTTINAYPTNPSPQAGAAADNAADTGALFYLGLSVPLAGNHIIYIVSDSATIFRNNNISTNPYPFTIPGVFSLTGNSAVTTANPGLYEQYYYFFYDMRIQTTTCPSARVPVVASPALAPVISLSGNVLTSTGAGSYQWYLNDKLLAGATGQTDTALISGSYKVVATDGFGCTKTSNALVYASGKGGAISLLVHPNPSNGKFTVNFVTSQTDNVDLILLNTLGQEVYKQSYPNFSGPFASQVNAENLSPGMYYLKVLIGKNAYLEKLLIVR